jgi:hypothetical protein
MLSKDILDWIYEQDGEFLKKDIKEKFKLNEADLDEVIRLLLNEKILLEPFKEKYVVSDKAMVFKNRMWEKVGEALKGLLKNIENIQSTEKHSINDWTDITEIDKLVIFDGAEKIYEIHKNGKVIRIEGKDITDYKVFILKLFEAFGIMLPAYKGVGADWAKIVTYWYRKYGEISKDKVENLSNETEAQEILFDYINNCTLSDNHVFREGLICLKDNCLYVPTKIIKKILKRSDIAISMRKLSYLLNDYLESSSIPLKIENRTERFWKFKKDKFELKIDNLLQIKSEEEDSDETTLLYKE